MALIQIRRMIPTFIPYIRIEMLLIKQKLGAITLKTIGALIENIYGRNLKVLLQKVKVVQEVTPCTYGLATVM